MVKVVGLVQLPTQWRGDPVRQSWQDAARGFDLFDPRRVRSLYILVPREALSHGDRRHLNWGVLVDV